MTSELDKTITPSSEPEADEKELDIETGTHVVKYNETGRTPLRKGTLVGLPQDQDQDPRQRRLEREKTLERTYSISTSLRGPTRVDPSSRVVGEFKTLSIQLSQGGLAEHIDKKKKEAKNVKELSELEWHKLSANEIIKRFSTSLDTGLDNDQVQRRIKQYGRNEMSKPPRRLFQKIMGYIFGGFGSVLLLASIICFIAWKPLGEPAPQVSNLALACVVLFVIVLQAGFNAAQDYSSSRIMASIAGMLPEEVVVLRDGSRHSIPASEVVQGDIVMISLGNKIAADCRIISHNEAKFDRSVVTGEAEAITATVEMTEDNYLETRNIALAGTSCVSGAAIGVVVATGDSTVFGRIAAMSNRPKPGLTTLEKEVRVFVLYIGGCAITISIICVIIWAAYLRPKHPGFMSTSALLINVVSILVAFVPEGMPVAVTLSLTVVARKMAKSKILCKQLSTCETLGSISVLCSDKTGTLTTNQMTVVSIGVHGFESTPLDARDHITTDGPLASVFRQLQWVGAVCNAAVFDASTSDLPMSERKVHGDATDSAVLKMAEEIAGVDQANRGLFQKYTLAFNSKNKFMLKLVGFEDPSSKGTTEAIDRVLPSSDASQFDADTDMVLLVKGAPDVLLKRSTMALDASGQVIPLTDSVREQIVAMQSQWSSRGQRVLLLARRIIRSDMIDSSVPIEDAVLTINSELTVVGLVGIVDPPRPEIPEVVATCRGAGIRFFMVTGDFQLTAEAIARQCGIVTTEKVAHFDELHAKEIPVYDTLADNDLRPQNALSLAGTDLMKMNEADWEQACRYDELVFSRTTPEQKLRIVKEFQARGCCVGMTGDGVNDAPSLKQADIGIAMGGGSAVAMEAADMVLLDSFSSVIDALLYGRLVFVNLKKTIAYLLPAGSIAELWPVLLAFFFGLPQILSNLQMIFICVGTDVLPAISLVYEKPESDLLKRKPRSLKKDRLVDWKLLFHAYVMVGTPLTMASCAMGFWWMQRKGIPFSSIVFKYGVGAVQVSNPDYFAEILSQANAVYFFNLVIMQWFNLLSWRTQRLSSLFQQPPIFNKRTHNLIIFPAMIFALVLAIFLSYIPGLQKVFLTRTITVEHYFLPIAFGIGMLLIEEARKYLVRTFPKSALTKLAW